MSMGSRTFVVRVVQATGGVTGRGVIEEVASGSSVAFTSGEQLLDIVFGHGGSEGDVEPPLDV